MLFYIFSDGLELDVGKWVLVRYDDIAYPGEIFKKENNQIKVNVMHPSGTSTNKFRWPEKPDIHTYMFGDVIKHLEPPIPCSSRAAFFTFLNI